MTLDDVDNVVLSGDTLTYKDDCKVTIQASAESGTVTYQKEITITHDNADAIWFEDSAVLSLLTNKGVGSGGKITYTQAAAVTTFKINSAHTFQGNTTIRRFKEYRFFTSAQDIGTGASSSVRFDGCTNLVALSLPPRATATSNSLVSLSSLEELEIDSNLNAGFISSAGNTNLKSVKVGENATALNQTFQSYTSLTTVDLGSGISSVPDKLLKSSTGMRSLTLRYNGKVTKSDQMFLYLTAGTIDLYVPSDQVSNYAGYDNAIKEVHAITD
jgi:hypothetical protein